MQMADPFDGVSNTTDILTDPVDSETSYVERRNHRQALAYASVARRSAAARFSIAK